MTQSRDVQVECAIAFGRSHAWMLAHGYTRDDINRAVRRMNAADQGDNAAWVAALSAEDSRRVARANRRSVRDNRGDNKTVGPGTACDGVIRGLTPSRRG